MFYFRGTRNPDFSNISKIDYDAYWRLRGFSMRSKLMDREEIFFDWIKPKSKVLDLGCGNSRLLFELREKKSCQVVGTDISPLVIAGLKQVGFEAFVANVEDPAFQISGHYDYIIMSELLEHLRDPEDLLKKLVPRAANFILSVPNSAFYRYRLGLMFHGRFFTQWVSHPSEHLRFWSHRDFLDWLTAMGLETAAAKASNGFWFKDLWPNLFGHQICYLAKTKV